MAVAFGLAACGRSSIFAEDGADEQAGGGYASPGQGDDLSAADGAGGEDTTRDDAVGDDAASPGDEGCSASVPPYMPVGNPSTACWDCASQSCSSQIAACRADCACSDALGSALACLAAGSGAAGCFTGSSGGPAWATVATCIVSNGGSCGCPGVLSVVPGSGPPDAAIPSSCPGYPSIPFEPDAAPDTCALTPADVACTETSDCVIYTLGTCGCVTPVYGVNRSSAVRCVYNCPPPPPPPGCPSEGRVTQTCQVVDDPTEVEVACVNGQCVTYAAGGP
jgi:hypothetical protein